MQPRNCYHVYTHANGFENLFQNEDNYRYFLLRYQHFIEPVADTLVYCLMPNHIHFLIRIKTEGELVEAFPNLDPNLQGFKNLGGCNPIEKRISQQFSNLFNSYTKAFNKMYERKGSLFIPNFKRKKIETDQHLTNIIHYIHANPVHHGFVETISVGPWSSYREIISEKQTWLMREEVVRWFGNINEFINFHLQPILFKSEIEKL